MINKINLFNFGSPAFIVSISTKIFPKVAIEGDYVMREGEYAEEMYFIKEGEVEVLATDGQTRIAVLRQGAYFGEIGLLITGKRTVSVRALTYCIFEVIDKENFQDIMETYPEHFAFLLKVAK